MNVRLSRRSLLAAAGAGTVAATAGCDIATGGGKDKVLHLNYGGSANTIDIPEDNPISAKLQEVTGYKVVIDKTPQDLGAALAGGQAPDIFLSSRQTLQRYATQGLLLDLTPHRSELADYESFVGKEAADVGVINDKLYGIVRKPREFSYTCMWIRADWLKNLGLDMPKDLDSFRTALTKFTTGDPNGNGKSDTIGLTGVGIACFDLIYGAYGLARPGSFYAKGSEIVNGYLDTQMSEPLKYIASLFSDKLIDPDLFSIDSNEARDRAFQGKAGVINASWDQIKKEQYVKASEEAQPGSDWQQLPVLAGPGASAGAMPTSTAPVVQGIPASVGDDSDKLEALIKLLNYISTDEGNKLVCFGIEGTHYKMDGDSIVPLPAMDTDGAYFFAYQETGRNEDVYLATKFPKQADYVTGCRERDRVLYYDGLVIPPDGFSQADAARYGEEQTVGYLTGETPVSDFSSLGSSLNSQFKFDDYVSDVKKQLAALGIPAS